MGLDARKAQLNQRPVSPPPLADISHLMRRSSILQDFE
jgi:hypothetical protein